METYYYHPVEKFQVWPVQTYCYNHPRHKYQISFADGRTYIATFEDAYDSDNSGELDIEMEDPRYDEFHQIVFRVTNRKEANKTRIYNNFLSIDYRDFPQEIKDMDANHIVYIQS